MVCQTLMDSKLSISSGRGGVGFFCQGMESQSRGSSMETPRTSAINEMRLVLSSQKHFKIRLVVFLFMIFYELSAVNDIWFCRTLPSQDCLKYLNLDLEGAVNDDDVVP